jgi:multiple sugar transport system substrate-binding protein
MCSRAISLAVMLMMAPFGSRGADLVVWWERGFYPQEDEAVAEIIEAFEQETGKQVQLVQPAQYEVNDKVRAALAAGRPPDFLYGTITVWGRWAYEDQLAELADVLRPVLDLFDADAVDAAISLNGRTGQRGLYGLPMGRRSHHVHVWKSFLERAGFTLADIPKEWGAFWSFWCDRVQPAVREALGRDDVWGIGLPMSVQTDTQDAFFQFLAAYKSDYVTRDGRLVINDPAIRRKLIKVVDRYTAFYRKGCIQPDSTSWDPSGNNKAFTAQTVVMTTNATLSIPGALRTARPDDYYENAATIDWPDGANGQPLLMDGGFAHAVVFKDGKNPALACDFVRFLAEGWIAHWLTFAGDRWMPPIRKLVEQPFWLDPRDPHRMRAAIQILTRRHQYNREGVRDNEW